MSARASSAVCQHDHCGDAEGTQQWTRHGTCADPCTLPKAYERGSCGQCLKDLSLLCAGLNTVEMLKIASSGLGMAPAQAMRTAESLYTSGYLSYPRTGQSSFIPAKLCTKHL